VNGRRFAAQWKRHSGNNNLKQASSQAFIVSASICKNTFRRVKAMRKMSLLTNQRLFSDPGVIMAKTPAQLRKFCCSERGKFPDDAGYPLFWQEVKFFPFLGEFSPLIQHLDGLTPLTACSQKFCWLPFSDSCKYFLALLGR